LKTVPRRDFLKTGLGVGCAALLGDRVLASEKIGGNGWVKSPANPMLGLSMDPNAFDSGHIKSPSVVKHRGKYYLYYSGAPFALRTTKDGGRYRAHQIGLATSNDGVHWRRPTRPLFPAGEHDYINNCPAILRDLDGQLVISNGFWHMVYCLPNEATVWYARSRDGLNWEKPYDGPILHDAFAPCVVQVGDEIWMYYTHIPEDRDHVPWDIRLAVGSDFQSLKPVDANPLLELSQDWEARRLIYPEVLREGNTWIMFYTAYWNDPARRGARLCAIGMATSPDGLHWTKRPENPVLTSTPGSSYDSLYASNACILRDGDEYKCYYAGRIDEVHKYYSINLATKKGPILTPR